AERVELFGQNLPGGNDGYAVATVFLLDALDLGGGMVQRRVPAHFAIRIYGLFAQQRLRAAVGGIEQLVLEDPLDAELALIDWRVGDTAGGHRLAPGIEPDLDRAAGRAVAAGGVLPVDHALIG